VIRTSVNHQLFDSPETVRAYKSLSTVERAFRSYKTVDLKVRPIHHRLAFRARVHVFLCMLAYYVEWHMRSVLATLLFDDEQQVCSPMQDASPVAPASRSPHALGKTHSKRTEDNWPVHIIFNRLSVVSNPITADI
jgi:hypothetical protein